MNQRIEEEHLLEIEKISFPRKDRILGFIKGASCLIESLPFGAVLQHFPYHTDRGFKTFEEGIFWLREIGRTGITFVNDTVTIILCGIGRMMLNISSVAYWALES